MEEPELRRAVVMSTSDPIGNAVPGTGQLATPVLDQNEYWWTADGRALKLDEMTPGHRGNLINWLEQRALILLIQYQVEYGSGPFAPNGDMATLAFDRWLDEEFMKWHERPVEWLQQTPFYQRLRWLIEQDRKNGEAF